MPQPQQQLENQLPLRVFMVEDSSVFRTRFAQYLATPGRIEISGYADSEKPAIEALLTPNWDVLILDLELKQGNGMEVLKVLHSKGRPVHTKVIVLTDHDYYLYRRKSTEHGADYFFNKSFEIHLLVAVLDQMICERQISIA